MPIALRCSGELDMDWPGSSHRPRHSESGFRSLHERELDGLEPMQLEIPSLTGLRGVAALAVVIYHYSLQRKFMSLFPGPYAVTLFFELSGLLITWLLLKEIDETALG